MLWYGMLSYGMLLYGMLGYAVSSVGTFDLFTCAPFSVSCVFRRESVVLISFWFFGSSVGSSTFV